jgi:hypothetical protein
MKTKLMACLLAATILFTFDGCKKKEEPKPTVPDESTQSTEDNRDAQGENDAIVSDINNIIGDESQVRGRVSSPSGASGITGTICGVTVDTTGISSGSLTLNFDGVMTCNNRTRSGAVKVSVVDYATGKRWKQPGCSIRVEYVNYKVIRASDQKSIQFNGVQYVTNASGGTWWELLVTKTQTAVIHAVTGTNLNAMFSDGKTAVYNIHRQVTWSLPGGVITCKGEGIGTNNGMGSLENYGTTRDGDAFYSQVSTPIVWNLTCGAGAPITGDVTVQLSNKAFGLRCVFGTDSNGNPMTVGPNQCPFGWRFEWTVDGQTQTKIFGYK